MLQLTSSQQAAVQAFKDFLEGDDQVFILKGAAGTGKTTIVSEFIRNLENTNREYHLMAPTGRAAYILGNKTGKEATTIHRGIYGVSTYRSTDQNDDDEENGGLHVKYGLKINSSPWEAIYIIDESSMISDAYSENEAFSFGSGRLLSDLFEYAGGRKLVFVGDYAQLPPVGMNFSPALDPDYLSQQFNCRVTEFMLKEIMRQSNGGCMFVNANRIRDHIESKTFIEFKLDNGEDTTAEDNDLLEPYYELNSQKPSVWSAIIAYSNRQALQYNLAIRQHYFGLDTPRLNKGDLLLIARNNYAYEEELFNGNIVQVEACQPDAEVLSRHVRIKLGKDHIESVELRFRKATIRFGVNGKPVSINVMLLDNFLDDPNGSIGGLLSRALVVDFNNRLPEKIKSRLGEIRNLMRSKGPLSIAQKELVDTYVQYLRNDPYYNAVICKYGYAMTCHKAQGGEWDNVFVDMCRFGGTANEDYFRWAYTALTRASKHIWHFHSPDFNYISNLVVEDIKPSSKIRVSCYAEDSDFCSARFERIKEYCVKYGVKAEEDRSKPFQHIITFTGAEGNSVVYQLWYNKKAYSGKDILIRATSDELKSICSQIITDSSVPLSVPFSAPDRPFAEKLVSFMRTQFEETGIRLLDITQEQYQDVFHVQTDGLAQIGLAYTAKGNYTYMRLVSSLGLEDGKLQAFRKRFI